MILVNWPVEKAKTVLIFQEKLGVLLVVTYRNEAFASLISMLDSGKIQQNDKTTLFQLLSLHRLLTGAFLFTAKPAQKGI